MNFDLTRSNLFVTTLYSVVLLVVLWGLGASVTDHSVVVLENPNPYWISAQLDLLIAAWPNICKAISALLAFVCSLMVARLAIRNVLYLERTYMPSLLFVVFSSSFYTAGESVLPLVVAVLITLALGLIFRSYMYKGLATGIYLSAGFCFGLSAAIYPPSAYLGFMLFVGLAAFRMNNLREWVSAAVGLCLPLGLFFYALWWGGGEVAGEWRAYVGQLGWHDRLPRAWEQFTLIDYTMVGVTAVLVVFSYITFLRSRSRYKLRGVMTYHYLMAFLLWTVVVALISPVRTMYLLPVASVGLSVVIPTYFASRKATFLSNFLYALLLLSAMAIHLVRS